VRFNRDEIFKRDFGYSVADQHPDNFKSVMSLCREAKEQDNLTVCGSVHISQFDFSLVYPKLSSLLPKMTVNPQRAIDLNVNASLEFLKGDMPAPLGYELRH